MSFFKDRLANLSPEQKAESDIYRQLIQLGSTIRVARSERGWSQAELAERSGIAQSDISKVEKATLPQGPTAMTLCRLAAALDMQVTLKAAGPHAAPQAVSAADIGEHLGEIMEYMNKVRAEIDMLTRGPEISTSASIACAAERQPATDVGAVMQSPRVQEDIARLVLSVREAGRSG